MNLRTQDWLGLSLIPASWSILFASCSVSEHLATWILKCLIFGGKGGMDHLYFYVQFRPVKSAYSLSSESGKEPFLSLLHVAKCTISSGTIKWPIFCSALLYSCPLYLLSECLNVSPWKRIFAKSVAYRRKYHFFWYNQGCFLNVPGKLVIWRRATNHFSNLNF